MLCQLFFILIRNITYFRYLPIINWKGDLYFMPHGLLLPR